MTERIKQSDIHEVVRQHLMERERNRNHATRMFRSLGKRTLHLIRQVGIAQIETSRSMRRFTSKNVGFQLPNYDEEHTLSFSVEKDRNIPFVWEEIIGITACLDIKGNTSPVALACYGVDTETYINGISMPADAKWLGISAVPKYEERVAGFINLLEVGEALSTGQPVDALLDRLPFFTSDGENTVPVLSAGEGFNWPMLHAQNSSTAEQELDKQRE